MQLIPHFTVICFVKVVADGGTGPTSLRLDLADPGRRDQRHVLFRRLAQQRVEEQLGSGRRHGVMSETRAHEPCAQQAR